MRRLCCLSPTHSPLLCCNRGYRWGISFGRLPELKIIKTMFLNHNIKFKFLQPIQRWPEWRLFIAFDRDTAHDLWSMRVGIDVVSPRRFPHEVSTRIGCRFINGYYCFGIDHSSIYMGNTRRTVILTPSFAIAIALLETAHALSMFQKELQKLKIQ